MTKRMAALLAVLLWPALAAAQTYTTSPPPYLLATNASGQIFGNACVWTYQAGTTTPVTTYSNAAGTPNPNPIRSDGAGRFTAFLVPGSTYRFYYETSCTPPAHGTLLKDADNIAAMPASSASVDIPGTAGESITAGQCVYLSDGSGAKTAGQWFKCDSGNTYSSTTPEVGLATAAAASAAALTVRIAGRMTGLTSLSVGSEYFASTGGAVTTTAPTNRRHLGHADSASSLVLTGDPTALSLAIAGAGLSVSASTTGYTLQTTVPGIPCGRLTLTAATPVTTADVTGASAATLRYTPYLCNTIALYDGSTTWTTRALTEISIAVPATTVTMYDVWVFDNSGTPALEVLAWTNDTTRATALVLQDGVPVKTGATTRRYVGSFRTAGVSGQTEDSVTKRYVWNYYNRVDRILLKQSADASWNATSSTIRQANANSANQFDAVIGVAEDPIRLDIETAFLGTATVICAVGVGVDSTTAFSGQVGQVTATVNGYVWAHAVYRAVPTVGKHTYSWNEADASNTNQCGVVNTSVYTQPGLYGLIRG